MARIYEWWHDIGTGKGKATSIWKQTIFYIKRSFNIIKKTNVYEHWMQACIIDSNASIYHIIYPARAYITRNMKWNFKFNLLRLGIPNK